jgi:uncharacterized protein YecE (DUF72 family)
MRRTPAPHSLAAVRIGTAGWSIPKQHADAFPTAGSHLERYGAVFDAVEINSSFYRPHRPATYRRWADAVPESFRFSVKMPRSITHERRLVGTDELLASFLAEVSELRGRLGPLLVQLPPSLGFEGGVSDRFLRDLRSRTEACVVCEPRHRSWFTPAVDDLLAELRIARVAADPEPVAGAGVPGGWRGLSYRRLHGSPRIYYSAYADEFLERVAAESTEDAAAGAEAWCIFDNTAAFAATGDALTTRGLVRRHRPEQTAWPISFP